MRQVAAWPPVAGGCQGQGLVQAHKLAAEAVLWLAPWLVSQLQAWEGRQHQPEALPLPLVTAQLLAALCGAMCPDTSSQVLTMRA